MHSHFQAIFCFAVAAAVTIVPVIVTGKPQQQLGGLWIGQVPESPKNDDASAKPSGVSLTQGGLNVIPEKSDFTGNIKLEVFLTKPNSDGELVKIHGSNSTFTIPQSFYPSSEKSKSGRNDKRCGDLEFLYEPNGKCYREGPVSPELDSPCMDDFMQFVQLSDKPGFGGCFCLRFRGSTTRPVVYWEKSNRCFWLYDQGPCEKGEWLVYSNTTDSDGIIPLVCTKRTCPENTFEDEINNFPPFWFEHQGKCLRTETKSIEFCGAGKKKVYFSNEKAQPICAERRPMANLVKGLVSGVNYLNCKAGHKRLPSGDCKRVASFE